MNISWQSSNNFCSDFLCNYCIVIIKRWSVILQTRPVDHSPSRLFLSSGWLCPFFTIWPPVPCPRTPQAPSLSASAVTSADIFCINMEDRLTIASWVSKSNSSFLVTFPSCSFLPWSDKRRTASLRLDWYWTYKKTKKQSEFYTFKLMHCYKAS